MLCRQLIRTSWNNLRQYATEASPLAQLRKKTGYSFVNCKKALELNNNDVAKSEQWLREQAQALGWAKVTKLQGRITTQGLVGVVIQRNIGAMVEVNCETDFVARNEHFQQFVESASRACLNYVNDLPTSDLLSRTEFHNESLKNLIDDNGKKLGDALALMVGTVGENASLRRAVCIKVPEEIQLTGMAYPTATNLLATDGNVHLGAYGTLLGVRGESDISDDVQKNLCLHVIGMNPLKIGEKEVDKPCADKEDETCLIHQDYLFGEEEQITVGELLERSQMSVIDFQRFRCGENIESENVNKAAAAN